MKTYFPAKINLHQQVTALLSIFFELFKVKVSSQFIIFMRIFYRLEKWNQSYDSWDRKSKKKEVLIAWDSKKEATKTTTMKNNFMTN